MHSQYLVDAAQKCGVNVERLVLKSDELPLYQSILKEVERWMEEWKNKINVVEQLARAEFLLWPWGAHKVGVNTRQISVDPLSVYIVKKRRVTEVGVMAQFDCMPLVYNSFVGDAEVSWSRD